MKNSYRIMTRTVTKNKYSKLMLSIPRKNTSDKTIYCFYLKESKLINLIIDKSCAICAIRKNVS